MVFTQITSIKVYKMKIIMIIIIIIIIYNNNNNK